MRRAEPTKDLADVVKILREQLATAEAARVNPADVEITAIRAELDQAQARLVAREEAEAAELRRGRAADALRAAECELVAAKSDLDGLQARYRSLPGEIQVAQFRFGQAQKGHALAKQNLERNNPQ